MRPEIDVVLAARGGAASRADLFTVVTRNQLDDEVARGHLVAVFPRAYCRPWDLDDPAVLEAAAVHSVGAPVVLSHVNALRRWSLPTPPQRVVHVTVPADRHPMGRRPGLFVHRTRVRLRARTVDGLLTVAPAVAVVRSWPMLAGPEQRGPAIAAVRDRLVGVDDLRAAASAAPGLSGRKRLFELIDLLAAGCESELEIWGHLGVFDVPGLRHGKRQLWVSTAAGPYRADIGYEEERVAVELDGHRFHGRQAQRERDMRRDAALAAMGWLTLRFSHQRLHDDVDGCRRDTLAALAARRRRAS